MTARIIQDPHGSEYSTFPMTSRTSAYGDLKYDLATADEKNDLCLDFAPAGTQRWMVTRQRSPECTIHQPHTEAVDQINRTSRHVHGKHL